MGIGQPIVSEIAWRTWCIDEFGMDALFLLEGSEKALLIDTGTGLFNIPELVGKLTQKPLMVAATHGHVDHVGGMDQFDQVYMHPDDFGIARAVTPAERSGYAAMMLEISGGMYDIKPDDIIIPEKQAELLPLKEGDIIRLGGRDIAVFETPGHTEGGLSFIDAKERILFSGDACNVNTLLALSGVKESGKTTVSALRNTAEKLERLHPFYDRNYNGHIGYAAMKNCLPMPDSISRDCIELCTRILDGREKGEGVKDAFSGTCLAASYGACRIVYLPGQVS